MGSYTVTETVATTTNRSGHRNGKPEVFTLQQVRTYNEENKAHRVIYKNKVYDLTKFKDHHPGGNLPIVHMSGKDATDQMTAFHPVAMLDKKLPAFYVGDLDSDEVVTTPSGGTKPFGNSSLAREFRKMVDEFNEEGWYSTNYSFYYKTGLWVLSLYAAFIGLTLSGWAKDVPTVTLAACLNGFAWQQLSFIAHDLGHNGITHIRKIDHGIGIVVANYMGGLSMGWWKHSHNVHHIVTNSPVHDPDIQHMPFFAVSNEFFKSLYSTYHKRVMDFDAASRFLVSLQHYLYLPIMLFGRFNLYAQSLIYLASKEKREHRGMELAGIAFFCAWYGSLLSYLPSWDLVILYIFISHAFTAILHIQITVSHFSMSTEETTDEEEWIRHQLRTTMDVICGKNSDWFHGGLQFQVIHHLFPRMPRHRLREARNRVIDFCRSHKLEYTEKPFFPANGSTISRLKEVADKVKFCAEHGMN